MILNRLAVSAVFLMSTALASAHADAFNRIASFPVPLNLPGGMDRATETSSEIIDATDDGMMLVYTDAPVVAIGLIDITDPASPQPGGTVMMDGEPTSLVVGAGKAFVAVNTSESYTAPSGVLKVVDLATKAVGESCALGGQPDSTAIAPDGSFLAIAVENERDEDLNDGVIPQLPAGEVRIIPLADHVPDCANSIAVSLTGLAEVAPADPEPEFVDINGAGEIVVTLQENNHIVILDQAGTVLNHFSAGSVTLDNLDTDEEGAITFGQSQTRKREPDAAKWLDNDRFVTANEGDYEGGSRGFTVFHKDGRVAFESGLDFEYAVAAAGHYPEGRSGNKGVEPEGLAVGTFGDTPYIFVLSERGNLIGVYDIASDVPVLRQLLPSGIGPEGAVAIPQRNLLVSANEVDLVEDGGVRAHVMIYAYEAGAAPDYPTLMSVQADDGVPIGWGALSGLVADETTPGRFYAVSDSFYRSAPKIFEIDASTTPATNVRAIPVTRDGAAAQKLDLEGIATDGDGGFWLASEGRTDRLIPHALYHVNAAGEIEDEVPFPAELLAGEQRFGAEGVTRVGNTLWIAIQRELGDDPKDHAKLVSYDTKTGDWGAVHYKLEAAEMGWMGLSEITAFEDNVYIVERDNQIGGQAVVKRIYRVPLADMTAAPLGQPLPVVTKTLVRDLIPDLERWRGYVVDKVEGFAIDGDGIGFALTDNDGNDGSSGETFFWSIGRVTH